MNKSLFLFRYANIIGGLLLLAFWYLYAILLPYQQLDDTLSILVKDKHWGLVNVLGVSGSIISLIGFIGIYIQGFESLNSYGQIGFLLAIIGTVLLTGALLWDTIIWPILVNYDAAILSFRGPIYSSKSFVPFFISAGLIYAIGYLMFGLSIGISKIYPLIPSLMIAIGAPLFGLGSLFGKAQVVPRSIGITLFGIGVIWLGSLLTI